jgi:Right handed beta helix region
MVIADSLAEHPRPCNAARVVKTGLACLLTLGSVVAWTLGAQAAAATASTTCDLYASNSGNDSNPGTASAPLRTLKKLLTTLAAGQTGCLTSGQTFDGEPDSTGNGSIVVRGGETHGAEGVPVTITSTDPSNPAVISHSVSLEGGADWITFTHLKFDWAQPGQCSWTAEGNPYNCPEEDHVQIAVSSKHTSWTWDEITSEDTNICVNLVSYGGSTAEYTLIEHDRIHDCGTPVTNAHPTVNEEPGWHEHGIYDYGNFTTIRNNYIYNASRDGMLFYPQGSGAVVEHNVIDSNGAGVSLAGVANVLVRWNIITNAYSPRGYDEDGVNSNGAGAENLAEHNCLYNNPSGEIDLSSVTLGGNLTGTNPLYVSAANHDYSLEPTSPCLGYGPDTAQPTATSSTNETTSSTTGTTTTKKGAQKRGKSTTAVTAHVHHSGRHAKHARHRRHARHRHHAKHRRRAAGYRRHTKGARRHARGH